MFIVFRAVSNYTESLTLSGMRGVNPLRCPPSLRAAGGADSRLAPSPLTSLRRFPSPPDNCLSREAFSSSAPRLLLFRASSRLPSVSRSFLSRIFLPRSSVSSSNLILPAGPFPSPSRPPPPLRRAGGPPERLCGVPNAVPPPFSSPPPPPREPPPSPDLRGDPTRLSTGASP